jgi:hypothetical protein
VKIEMRFGSKPPKIVDEVERITIEHEGMTFEIYPGKDRGLMVRKDLPIPDRLVIEPHASNAFIIRTKDRPDRK